MKSEVKTMIFLEEEDKELIQDFYYLIENICDESDLIECEECNCPFQNFCYRAVAHNDETEDMTNHIIEMFEKININVSK